MDEPLEEPLVTMLPLQGVGNTEAIRNLTVGMKQHERKTAPQRKIT